MNKDALRMANATEFGLSRAVFAENEMCGLAFAQPRGRHDPY
jgi:hypothetical protein